MSKLIIMCLLSLALVSAINVELDFTEYANYDAVKDQPINLIVGNTLKITL